MISRRAMLGLMGGLPFARPDQHYEPPQAGVVPGARSGILLAKKVVIIAGAGGGLFAYSPTTGAGNLIASIATSFGTDQYGNAYVPGIAAYIGGGTPSAVQMFNGFLNFYSAATEAGPWNQQGDMVAGGGLSIQSQTPLSTISLLVAGSGVASFSPTLAQIFEAMTISAGASAAAVLDITNTTAAPANDTVRIHPAAAGDRCLGIRVTGETNDRVFFNTSGMQCGGGSSGVDVALLRAAANQWIADYIAFNNGGAAEVWNAATFTNSWANTGTGPGLQFRRVAAPYKCTELVGRVTAPAGIVAGQQVMTAVPAAYRPANLQSVIAVNTTTGAVVRFTLATTGTLNFQTGAVAGDVIDIPAGNLISQDA